MAELRSCKPHGMAGRVEGKSQIFIMLRTKVIEYACLKYCVVIRPTEVLGKEKNPCVINNKGMLRTANSGFTIGSRRSCLACTILTLVHLTFYSQASSEINQEENIISIQKIGQEDASVSS